MNLPNRSNLIGASNVSNDETISVKLNINNFISNSNSIMFSQLSLLLIFLRFSSILTDEQCLIIDRKALIDDSNCPISLLNDVNNQRLQPLLQQLVKKNYFRFFPVNLHKKCQFWSDQGQCSLRTCAIKSCSIETLPDGLRDLAQHSMKDCHVEDKHIDETSLDFINKNLTEEQKQTIETWTKYDDAQAENFCDVDDENSIDSEYIDLAINPERYTGYTGPSTQRIWSAIYNENCFFLPDSNKFYNLRQKRLNSNKMCLEGRTFYRLISGLHTSITIHLCSQYFFPTIGGGYSGNDGQWRPNFDEFHRRFDPQMTDGEGVKWIENVYFLYLIELRAIYKAKNVLKEQIFFTGNSTDDAETKEFVVEQLLTEIEPLAHFFDEGKLFQNENSMLKLAVRDHFRNISRIMDCIGCDKCKLWGKLQTQALGTALKILFSDKPFQLQRSEIVALINGFTRLSTSIFQLENTFKVCVKNSHDEI